jgi:hypothetical protein
MLHDNEDESDDQESIGEKYENLLADHHERNDILYKTSSLSYKRASLRQREELIKQKREEAYNDSLKTPCPVCGGPLPGQYEKCMHCSQSLFWAYSKPFKNEKDAANHLAIEGQNREINRQRREKDQQRKNDLYIKQKTKTAARNKLILVAMLIAFGISVSLFLTIHLKNTTIERGFFKRLRMGSPPVSGAVALIAPFKMRWISKDDLIPNAFFMAETECSQGQWNSIMDYNPSNPISDELPVNNVNWEEAQTFCQKLNEIHHAKNVIPANWNWRLPSEIEWVYALRAKDTEGTEGDAYGELNSVAWSANNSGLQIHEVGTKIPNKWGLYDMIGNVQEWCGGGDDDIYNPLRRVRGSGFSNKATESNYGYVQVFNLNDKLPYVGFRIVLSKNN